VLAVSPLAHLRRHRGRRPGRHRLPFPMLPACRARRRQAHRTAP